MNIRGLKPGTVFFMMTLPAVLLYCLFFLAPVFIGFYYSLTNWDGFSLSYDMVGFQNYIDILQDKRFLNGLSFTLLYTVIVVFGKLSVALVLALLLSRPLKLRGLFRSIYFFPAVLSMITVGLMFNQFFYSLFPPIGEKLGIEWLSLNLLGNPDTAILGIALTNIWQGFAIPMVIFIAGLSNVPKDIIEAAVIDGASPVQRFFSITIPYLIPMLTVNVVLAVKGGLTVFDYIVAMTNGGPSKSTESMGFLIYQHGMSEMKFGYGTAEAIYVFILIGVLSFIQIKLLARKEVGQQ
ncbi:MULTISPECIES: carbohydrate ABC transporter permease [Paenibacillus]|uniref:Binding-protein-dependent transport systems inner membrane component n=2 Tax=Paenibacillus lactis TaxID=228574 RepID=G4H8T1_9BACL|nr:sugar ABC transporter permease [Paenibacillus lactis]EHB68266.1 binding-protein-dependent transport systems inner membrane component [Paenibacillus lactis 154]MBP1894217.1 raffinose/stachyose/melibiose transport system permease protein [Paenibacillus lactis]MCM3497112.1 sugar ABC transporter permease [Paenibacillus lactis]GIO89429.1 sugar ABC transporter permease [Paenibacillus lactis]HAF99603.1 sugar ABC transporter permease [Paenibacillus lactis]